jgi:serine phosphatase RsbU (regulator of sigma subunit)
VTGLLPESIPAIPGIDVAATCLPAGGDTEVCGDWYDVIPLPDGSAGFAIGDVVGRGAAATARVQRLRDGLREHALAGHAPGEVLRRLNALADDPRKEMSTVLFVVYDPATHELRGANAGHPPALIRRRGGAVERWDAGPSVPLGVVDDATFEEASTRLEAGDGLLLFTDGLVEGRDVPVEEALKLLELAIPSAGSAVDLRATVLDRMLAGHEHDDDVAVLALSIPG